MQDTKRPILIAGAGLCSLALAQYLRRASIPCIIYERDASASFRSQGYRIRFSSEGLDALEACLTPEAFSEFWEACSKIPGHRTVLVDAITFEEVKSSKDAVVEATPGGATLSLQSRGDKLVSMGREELREHLLKGLEKNICWSHHITGYEKTVEGVRLTFADGSRSEEGSLLVGGEGVRSAVANQLSDGKLKKFDTGGRGIHGFTLPDAAKDIPPAVYRIIDNSHSNGRLFCLVGVAPNANKPLYWAIVAQQSIVDIPNNDYSISGKPAADVARALVKDWHPNLRPVFNQVIDEDAAFWKVTCSDPNGVAEWSNDPRVTVIGDAVHCMTPAGGNGANTAFRDSALLGRLLAEAGGWRDGVTADYEKGMKPYAGEQVAMNHEMAKFLYGVEVSSSSAAI